MFFYFVDVEWLKLVKSDAQFAGLTENVMEKIIEELELGWNCLTGPLRKLQQRKEAVMFPEEVPCEICGDCDTSNCNVIVLCDDCDLAVHQECYGVPHIPEGPWLCRPCSEKKSSACDFKAKCMLCPWPGGALRKTTDHRWVHSLCAHLVPETTITFTPSDPYDLVDTCTLQSDRAKLKCVLCRNDPKCTSGNNGYPIQCSSKTCHVAFHPMCARAAGWTVDYTNQRSFCAKHATEDPGMNSGDTEERSKLKLRLNFSNSGNGTGISAPPLSPSKSKYPTVSIGENCPLHVFRGGEKLRIPAMAPKVLIDHIVKNHSVFASSIVPEAFKRVLVIKIAKYWALKREFRRGTPLLKSLQLDAGWSQADSMNEESFAREWTEKTALLKSLKSLKMKLNYLRLRELSKLESLKASVEIFEILSSPFSKILCRFVLKLQREVDKPGYFAYPVPCDLFPDYSLIVKYPMDFSTIMKNLKSDMFDARGDEKLFYPDLLHFYADLKLIWENSRLYNTKTSVFYQAADRLESYSLVLLRQIWERFKAYGIVGPFDILSSTDNSNLSVNENICSFEEAIKELPEPTPARFPKPTITSILSSEDSINSMKRRGRPPKRRDLVNEVEGIDPEDSRDSKVSKSSIVKPIKPSIATTNSANGPRKRGRPPKKQARIVEDEEVNEAVGDEDVFDDYMDSSPTIPTTATEPPVDPKNLVWVQLKSGNQHWCPGEIISSPKSRRNVIEVKLFDNSGTILTVPADSLKPFSEDFEKDLEELKIEGIGSRKVLFSAHRTALMRLKKE